MVTGRPRERAGSSDLEFADIRGVFSLWPMSSYQPDFAGGAF